MNENEGKTVRTFLPILKLLYAPRDYELRGVLFGIRSWRSSDAVSRRAPRNTMVDTMNLRRFILLRSRLVLRCFSALIAYPQVAILFAARHAPILEPGRETIPDDAKLILVWFLSSAPVLPSFKSIFFNAFAILTSYIRDGCNLIFYSKKIKLVMWISLYGVVEYSIILRNSMDCFVF